MTRTHALCALLGLLVAAPVRADESAATTPPVEAAPVASPATEAVPTGGPTTEAAAAPPALPPPAAVPPPPPPPPPAFATSPYQYRSRGRFVPPQVRAVRPRRGYGDAGAAWTVGIGGNYRFRDDIGYRRIGAGERQTELDLFVSHDVLQPVRPLVIAVGIDYRYGKQGGDLTVVNHGIAADVTARYALASWLFPQLRASFGLQTTRFEADAAAYGVALEDKTVGPLGGLGGGLLLRTPARAFETYAGNLSSLSLGVLVEAGYLFAKSAAFDARPESDSEVPQQRVAVGKLGQSSPYLRLMGILRF